MKVLNGYFMIVRNIGTAWVRHWSEVVLPGMIVFNRFHHSCQFEFIRIGKFRIHIMDYGDGSFCVFLQKEG